MLKIKFYLPEVWNTNKMSIIPKEIIPDSICEPLDLKIFGGSITPDLPSGSPSPSTSFPLATALIRDGPLGQRAAKLKIHEKKHSTL